MQEHHQLLATQPAPLARPPAEQKLAAESCRLPAVQAWLKLAAADVDSVAVARARLSERLQEEVFARFERQGRMPASSALLVAHSQAEASCLASLSDLHRACNSE
jgi:hypothetical protein